MALTPKQKENIRKEYWWHLASLPPDLRSGSIWQYAEWRRKRLGKGQRYKLETLYWMKWFKKNP